MKWEESPVLTTSEGIVQNDEECHLILQVVNIRTEGDGV